MRQPRAVKFKLVKEKNGKFDTLTLLIWNKQSLYTISLM